MEEKEEGVGKTHGVQRQKLMKSGRENLVGIHEVSVVSLHGVLPRVLVKIPMLLLNCFLGNVHVVDFHFFICFLFFLSYFLSFLSNLVRMDREQAVLTEQGWWEPGMK